MMVADPFARARTVGRAFAALVGAISCLFVLLVVLAVTLIGGVVHAQEPVVPHADDYLNAGLQAAEAGELGDAILAFERAHLAAPLDREIQDARASAQAEARRRRAEGHASQSFIEGEPRGVTWWRFFNSLRTDVFAGLLLGGTWLLFGLLFARRRAEKTAVKDALAVGAMLAFMLIIGSVTMWGGAEATQRLGVAVVVDEDVRFRDAPDELARLRSQPNLYQGAVVLILEARGEFSEIRLVDGEDVWVRTAGVEAVQ